MLKTLIEKKKELNGTIPQIFTYLTPGFFDTDQNEILWCNRGVAISIIPSTHSDELDDTLPMIA